MLMLFVPGESRHSIHGGLENTPSILHCPATERRCCRCVVSQALLAMLGEDPPEDAAREEM